MSELPTGTVTFLFTDIEGSTKLWEQHPEAMKTALAKHDSLLRGIFIFHNGYIFKTVGDAFYAAFASTSDALNAAIHSQRELQKEFSGEILIKVRMALHCGEVETRDNDYFGQPLNRVSRLLSAGHGRQVLISTTIKERLGPDLPQNISLRDMGEHKLKDVPTPMRIFQITTPDLQQEFPSLRTLSNLPNNLPAQVTSFIGREKEIEQVKEKIRSNRLITLSGVGGTGKTRLSLQTASALLPEFQDGVWFVELAPVTEPEQVPQAVATALQLHDVAERTYLDTITKFLQTRELLLLLDNCEHLLNSCAQLVDHLLRQCPKLKIITTSREPLGISGETIWNVPSLSLPQIDHSAAPNDLEQFEAVKLFIDRARAVQPAFVFNESNTRDVVKICARLDGIPLALELAAARVRGMDVAQIAARLDNQFRLLTGGSRAAMPRQQTLSALIDWSYNLLSDAERLLFQRLSIFTGLFHLDAVEEVCSDHRLDRNDVLDTLLRLVDKSLLVAEERSGETYYRLLETIRQYAREKLIASGETETLTNRHAQHFMKVTEKADYEIRRVNQLEWLHRLEIMRDNFRSAMEWLMETDQTAAAMQIVRKFGWFWFVRSDHNEGRQWLERILAMSNARAHPEYYVDILTQLAHHTWLQISPDKAKPMAEEALSIAHANNDKWNSARAMACLGLTIFRTDYSASVALFEESKLLFEEVKDEWNYAHATICLATAHMEHNQALSITMFEEALAHFRKLGDKFFQSVALRFIGDLAIKNRNVSEGKKALQEAMILVRQLESKTEIAFILWSLAETAQVEGNITRAVKLFLATKNIQESIGAWTEEDNRTLNDILAQHRSVMDEESFKTASEQGSAMKMEQSIEYALL